MKGVGFGNQQLHLAPTVILGSEHFFGCELTERSPIRVFGCEITGEQHMKGVGFGNQQLHLAPTVILDLAMKREKSKTDASKKTDTKLLVKKGSERAAKKPRKSKAGKLKIPSPRGLRVPSSSSCEILSYRLIDLLYPCLLLAGGDKWKSLTEEEKAPYVAKATKLKADYTKTMAAYNKGQSGGGGGSRVAATDEEEEEGEESDKSKFEVNDDDEDDEEEEV
ncbi:hypothetical protein ZIOFF_053717 [Zingiber officinale]|uniref:HMG box domain-containing protein n=1 Tax=Zingiber officinale TaxID=94328 RepID=A0A8J5FDI3_ZINOF|nr:hypothetical protein ZIOFF_053717 [Zingiber officinale]